MNPRLDLPGHTYVALTLLFTVYGQMVLKWQVAGATLPPAAADKLLFLLKMVLNPWIASGFVAAFLASLCWMAAMTRLEMSYAYPFMSLAFVLVMGLSMLLFDESISVPKVVGTVLVIGGLIVIARG